MAGVLTQDGANYQLALFSNSEQPLPFYYVALVTGDRPGVSAYGDELDEPAFPDYLRAVVENVSGNWFIQDGLLVNQVEISFPIPDNDWGTVSYWAICESEVGGRVFYVGDLDAFDVLTGAQPIIPAGGLSVSMELSSWQETE